MLLTVLKKHIYVLDPVLSPFFSSQLLIPFVTEIPCTEVPAQTKREDPDSKYFLRWNQVILTISHDIIVYGILYEMCVKKSSGALRNPSRIITIRKNGTAGHC